MAQRKTEPRKGESSLQKKWLGAWGTGLGAWGTGLGAEGRATVYEQKRGVNLWEDHIEVETEASLGESNSPSTFEE